MKLNKSIIVAGSAILSTLALSNTALASDWTRKSLTTADDFTHEQIFAVTSDATALTFVCKQNKLRAAISTENNDAESILGAYSKSKRRIKRDIAVTIDGDLVDSDKWMINPSSNVYVTPNRSITAKLYNAAVKQKSLSVQRKGEEKHDLAFPSPNEDFAKFGAACGVGTLKTG